MIRSNVAIALSLSLLAAVVGCGTNADDDAGGSNEALSSAAKSLSGRYADADVPTGGIANITLSPSGTYSAKLEAGEKIKCITTPCLLPESGKWTATGSRAKFHLTLRPSGAAAREYDATKTSEALTLTAAGATQTMQAVQQCGGIGGLQCKAGQECVDDPDDSCDPNKGGRDCSGICRPKAVAKQCGGFAGIQCDVGEECVDDPNDSCDPDKGGRDCSGICQPKSVQ